MIHYIKGTVTEALPGMIVIESNGIGYEVNVASNCSAILSAGTGEVITLYTAMLVREDDISLYGFADRESLAFFRLLLSVSGVGGKAALSVLSSMPLSLLARSIACGDDAALQKANGIGKKTAQRIVIDLRDKAAAFSGAESAGLISDPDVGSARDQALSALMVLGFSRTEALTALSHVKDENLNVEGYIREALRHK